MMITNENDLSDKAIAEIKSSEVEIVDDRLNRSIMTSLEEMNEIDRELYERFKEDLDGLLEVTDIAIQNLVKKGMV